MYTHCAHILYNVDSLSTVSTLARARALRPGRGFFASIKDHGCAVGGWKAGPANGEQARILCMNAGPTITGRKLSSCLRGGAVARRAGAS